MAKKSQSEIELRAFSSGSLVTVNTIASCVTCCVQQNRFVIRPFHFANRISILQTSSTTLHLHFDEQPKLQSDGIKLN